MDKVARLKEYAAHCIRMAATYPKDHPRWLFYSTMGHAKAMQARVLANRPMNLVWTSPPVKWVTF